MNLEKISKSRGSPIHPKEITDKFSVDSLRYFLAREVPFGLDGDFSLDNFASRYNTDLANDLGNLVHRVLRMPELYFSSKIPAPNRYTAREESIMDSFKKAISEIDTAYENYQPNRALEIVWELIRLLNRYVDDVKPWVIFKSNDLDRLSTIVYTLMEGVRLISIFTEPTLPDTSLKIREQINWKQSSQLSFELDTKWGISTPGIELIRGNPIFPKK
jgi:methionyl-tRNA synthetase